MLHHVPLSLRKLTAALIVLAALAAIGTACDDAGTDQPDSSNAGGVGGTTAAAGGGSGGSGGAAGATSASGGGGSAGTGGQGGGSCGDFPPGVGDQWEDPGPFSTTKLTLGPGDAFRVFQPDPLGEGGVLHPILVWSVGTGASPESYELLLTRIASHGIVVIAGDDPNQANGEQAISGLDWLVDQNDTAGSYQGKLDVTRIAAAGHSQGGNAALHVALAKPEVTAVAALMPGEGALGDATKADESLLTDEVFYICGSSDSITPPAWCLDRFANTASPAWVGVLTGGTHFVPTVDTANAAELRHWLIPWLRGQLLDDCDALPLFYGDPFALAQDDDWQDVDRKNL